MIDSSHSDTCSIDHDSGALFTLTSNYREKRKCVGFFYYKWQCFWKTLPSLSPSDNLGVGVSDSGADIWTGSVSCECQGKHDALYIYIEIFPFTIGDRFIKSVSTPSLISTGALSSVPFENTV